MKVDEVYFWTDSKICHWWIKFADKEWKAWVENDTNAIRALTDINFWRFVSGDCNPSDIGTRLGNLLIWKVMYCFRMDFLFCC